MRNLDYPLDWDGIFRYVGFPAFLKPHDGGGWKNVYKVDTPEEFFAAYDESGDLCMTLQAGGEIPGIFPLLRDRSEEGARHALRSRRAASSALRAGQSAAVAGAAASAWWAMR